MRRLHTRRLGFTLIELIVAMVVMGVIASVIAPRLVSTPRRRAENAARAAALLLSVAAHRDAMGSDTLAIEYDDAARTLGLLVLRRESTRFGGVAEPRWRSDPLVRAVDLPEGIGFSAMADGRQLDQGGWRFVLPADEPRADLEIRMWVDGTKNVAWIIALPPAGSAATLANPGDRVRPLLRSVDLDAAGEGDAPW